MDNQTTADTGVLVFLQSPIQEDVEHLVRIAAQDGGESGEEKEITSTDELKFDVMAEAVRAWPVIHEVLIHLPSVVSTASFIKWVVERADALHAPVVLSGKGFKIEIGPNSDSAQVTNALRAAERLVKQR